MKTRVLAAAAAVATTGAAIYTLAAPFTWSH